MVALRLPIKVVPGSSRNGIAGWLGETLRVRVTAPAEDGRANAAVEATLARALGLPRGAAKIVAGGRSPWKTVEIEGVSDAEVRRRLDQGTD
jgi:uncharacterized protein (TIGR00251 family)